MNYNLLNQIQKEARDAETSESVQTEQPERAIFVAGSYGTGKTHNLCSVVLDTMTKNSENSENF